ncbi:UNVERIFIED_CONTAM: Loganic acid O-methyltransferase [Sesamum indicum]
MLRRCAMNGGEGPHSYARNSSYQKGFVDVAKPIIEEEISRKLDIKHLSSTFRIADFGCSTGHNSCAAMQIITEAIRRRFEIEGLISQLPDFYVYFNDKVTNDFNTLFNSLPRERLYGAAGVPGSFHGRLLPKAVLNFAYSSCSLNWISEVPKAVLDNTSPAWNRGKIHYEGARREVREEYANQYSKDIESFLDSRAEELVQGGLMALLVPAVPASWDPNSAYTSTSELYLFGSCFMDMAKTKGVVDVAKPIIEEEISRKLDLKHLSSTFRIADFGCSTGHNSCAAIQIITEAIRRRFEIEGLISQLPDFYVYFNDKVTNDFNTLFNSLPRERLYGAAGVPGSFYGRLLPKAALNFAYSSCSLNWLSEVPKAVLDTTSPAWNRGKIHYVGARREVCEEYANQFAKDIESFLDFRAEELVPGGLMALLVPTVPASCDPNSAYAMTTAPYLLGSCFMDMAKTGRFSEAKVDSFNIPVYFPIPQEFKAIIERNGKYTIERIEVLDNPGKHNLTGPKDHAAHFRSVSEGMLIDHFGSEIIEELFDRYTKKLEASPLFSDPDCDKSIIMFVLLQRKLESYCSAS